MIRAAILLLLVPAAFALAESKETQAQTAGVPYCMEDYTHDEVIDIFDLGEIAARAFDIVPVGSPYDVAVPPDGAVTVIGDLGHVAGMFGDECTGFYEPVETQTQIGEGAAAVQITVTCVFRANQRHRHPFYGTPPDQHAVVDHIAWAYCPTPDPAATTLSCYSQIEMHPPEYPNWVWWLVASYQATSWGWYCTAESPYDQPAWLQTYIQHRARVCIHLWFWGEYSGEVCRGEEFPWMLVVH
jgi:hypothetical protein